MGGGFGRELGSWELEDKGERRKVWIVGWIEVWGWGVRNLGICQGGQKGLIR